MRSHIGRTSRFLRPKDDASLSDHLCEDWLDGAFNLVSLEQVAWIH